MTETDHTNAWGDLIPRAQRGDSAAYEQIVQRCQRRIRAWVAARCPPGADADEIAQKAFVAAFDRLDEFEVGTDFEAWLFTIARYQLMTKATRLRRQADYRTRFAPDLLAREIDRRARERADDDAGELLDHLGARLEKLPPRDRQALDWRYRDGVPLAEMGRRLGRTEAAVKKFLWVLRQKLRECIDAGRSAEV
jgi:RNA polymerase sigma-70 factor (ECF subfamily)